MQQEMMRAIVLLGRPSTGPDSLSDAEAHELRALLSILRRASRAMEGRILEELEATAYGNPQPKDT